MDGSSPTPALDDCFPRVYEVLATTRIETDRNVLYFPARPVLSIEVEPIGRQPWTAVFGEDFDGYLSGLFTTPDNRTLCVVCGGTGYFVETNDPERSWLGVECTPIRIALPFPKHGLIVFGDFTSFVAYGPNATSVDFRLDIAWRSARLGWDGLEVTRTSEDRIEGRAWHAPDRRMVGFSVDVLTGEHEGGAYPRDA